MTINKAKGFTLEKNETIVSLKYLDYSIGILKFKIEYKSISALKLSFIYLKLGYNRKKTKINFGVNLHQI